jgi:RNA polymerase sigma factor (sigma-70 family)
MAIERVEVTAEREILPSPRLPSDGRALLEQHLPLICRRLDRLSRRSGFPPQEGEELRAWALLKLVENDYGILARWEGRSSFSTFLAVVLVNLLRDYRAHVWGKWRPSAAARRRGPEAVLLERLHVRDGLALAEAIERVQAATGGLLSRAEAERMAASLRRRPKRRRVGEEELLQVPVDGQVESRIEDAERARTEERLYELLAPLLRSLPTQHRLLLKLYYWDGLSMAAISPLLGHSQRKLYSVRDKCLKRLRCALEKAGLSQDQLGELPGHIQLDLATDSIELLDSSGTGPAGGPCPA